jgi:hypothetical protein
MQRQRGRGGLQCYHPLAGLMLARLAAFPINRQELGVTSPGCLTNSEHHIGDHCRNRIVKTGNAYQQVSRS